MFRHAAWRSQYHWDARPSCRGGRREAALQKTQSGQSRTKKTPLPSFVKSLLGQETAQQIVVRQGEKEGLVRLPLQCIRIFTINDEDIETWLQDKTETLATRDLHAAFRRIVIIEVTGPLYTEDEAAEERAPEDEEDLAEAFRAMAARRAVSV